MKLSFSRINLYQRCPKQYEYACVKKIPRSISKAESFGSSVHNTLQKWGNEELKKKPETKDQLAMFDTEPTTNESLQLVASSLQLLWNQSFIYQGYDSKQEADEQQKRGEKLMEHFYTWWSKEERNVFSIETGFTLGIGDQIITGRFDRIEQNSDGSLHIIDFKTSRVREQQQVDNDLQLSIYALAAKQKWKKEVAKLTLLFVNENGCTEVSTVRNSAQLDVAKQEIVTAALGVEANNFTATPSENICKHCPYKNVCDSAVK